MLLGWVQLFQRGRNWSRGMAFLPELVEGMPHFEMPTCGMRHAALPVLNRFIPRTFNYTLLGLAR